jgi:hypothetical protein
MEISGVVKTLLKLSLNKDLGRSPTDAELETAYNEFIKEYDKHDNLYAKRFQKMSGGFIAIGPQYLADLESAMQLLLTERDENEVQNSKRNRDPNF